MRKSLLADAVRNVGKRAPAQKKEASESSEDSKHELLETAMAEFGSAKTAKEKVQALRAFIELANT